MFCTWCKDRCQDDSRYKCKGCDNPKVDAIQKHETKNAYHKKLNMRSLPQKKKKKGIGRTEASRAQSMLDDKVKDEMLIKIRNVHFIAKTDQSFRLYSKLCELDKAKGLTTSQYQSDKTAAARVNCPKTVKTIFVLKISAIISLLLPMK